MARCAQAISLFIVAASALLAGGADARSRLSQDISRPMPIVASSPTLAPFQHVRFCLHYPAECKSEARGLDRVEFRKGDTPQLVHDEKHIKKNHAHNRADPEKFFPTKMRITMIQVAKGSTYNPKLVPNLPEKK